MRAIVSEVLGAIAAQYRLGLGLFLFAPLAAAIVVLPEFAQHAAEIRIGMFDSLERARELANDPIRMAFGYAKIAGLVLAFLACARACWCRLHGGNWWDVREIAWPRLLGGLVLFFGIGLLVEPLAGHLSQGVLKGARFALSLLSLPFLFVAMAGLFGDRAPDWRTLLTKSWPFVLLVALLLVLGFGPAQFIHGFNHKIAFGQHPALVWALMVWDSLVVGALAALVGAGLAVAYDAFARRHSHIANHKD